MSAPPFGEPCQLGGFLRAPEDSAQITDTWQQAWGTAWLEQYWNCARGKLIIYICFFNLQASVLWKERRNMGKETITGNKEGGKETQALTRHWLGNSVCEICNGKQYCVCILLPVGLSNPGCAAAVDLICPPESSSSSDSDIHGNHTDTYCTDRRLSGRTAAKQSTTANLPITLKLYSSLAIIQLLHFTLN